MNHVAIQINPMWTQDDLTQARKYLVEALCKQVGDSYDTVERNTTFERRTDPGGELLVASYRRPVKPVMIVWPVEDIR